MLLLTQNFVNFRWLISQKFLIKVIQTNLKVLFLKLHVVDNDILSGHMV